MMAIEDGVALMRRDAERAAAAAYTGGMRERLAGCQAEIARLAASARRHVDGVDRAAAHGQRTQLEASKLRADLERVIASFNRVNKLCVGLEERPARRTVGSGIGPDPRSPVSSSASEAEAADAAMRRLDSLLGGRVSRASSGGSWWAGFVLTPRASTRSSGEAPQGGGGCACGGGPALWGCVGLVLACGIVAALLLLGGAGDLDLRLPWAGNATGA